MANPPGLADQLNDTVGSFQFAYFLFATNHSFDQYTAAGGTVPANLRAQLKSAIPSLIQFGIIDQDTITNTVSDVVNGLEAKDIMDMFKDGSISRPVFEQMYDSNPELQAAIQAGLQNTISTTSIGDGLEKFSGLILERDQFELADGSNLLDLKVGEIDDTRIQSIFVGNDDKPATLGADQIEYILKNLPPAQARTAIEKLGTLGDGSTIDGFPSISLPDDASRFQIQTAMDQAINARAEYETDNLSWIKERWVRNVDGNAPREGVLTSPETRKAIADEFKTMLDGFKVGDANALDGGSIYDFIVKDEGGTASLAVEDNIKNIRTALIKSAEGETNLNLFIDMLPDKDINGMIVDQIRNIGDQFPMLQGLLQLASRFLQGIAQAFPQIGSKMDVVANPIDTAPDNSADRSAQRDLEISAPPL